MLFIVTAHSELVIQREHVMLEDDLFLIEKKSHGCNEIHAKRDSDCPASEFDNPSRRQVVKNSHDFLLRWFAHVRLTFLAWKIIQPIHTSLMKRLLKQFFVLLVWIPGLSVSSAQ